MITDLNIEHYFIIGLQIAELIFILLMWANLSKERKRSEDKK